MRGRNFKVPAAPLGVYGSLSRLNVSTQDALVAVNAASAAARASRARISP